MNLRLLIDLFESTINEATAKLHWFCVKISIPSVEQLMLLKRREKQILENVKCKQKNLQ